MTLTLSLTLSHYLVLGALLFAISVVGIFMNRRNIIILLMAIELMLLAVNLNFIAFSHFLGDVAGPVLVLFIPTGAAAGPATAPANPGGLVRKLDNNETQMLALLQGLTHSSRW